MIFDLEDFHLAVDGDDWTPALMRAQLSVEQYTEFEVRCQARRYNCLERVDIIRPNMTIRGSKRGKISVSAVSLATAGTTTFSFPTIGDAGIIVHYPGTFTGRTYGASGLVVATDATARGDSFTLKGCAVIGPGAGVPYVGNRLLDNGVRFYARTHLEDFFVRGFRGDGVRIEASHETDGNANASSIRHGSIYGNGGYGLRLSGGDVNGTTIEDITFTDNGHDMKGRGGAYTMVLGQKVDIVTVNNAPNSTLFRLRIAGVNRDFTTPSSGNSIQSVITGLIGVINGAETLRVAVQISATQFAIYGNNNLTFTLDATGSVGSLTVANDAAVSTTPSTVYGFNGPANNAIQLTDNAQGFVFSGAYRGFNNGDVSAIDQTYGYIKLSTTMDRHRWTADDIALVSGSTYRMTISSFRSGPGPQVIGRLLNVRGDPNDANNSPSAGFAITACYSGCYFSSGTARFRVVTAAPGETSYAIINGTYVPITFTAGDTTVSLCRDRIIAAINAAAISGVTATVFDTDEFNVVGTGAITQNGPFFERSNANDRTIIEYTNAQAGAAANASFTGQWFINASAPPFQGVVSGFIYSKGAADLSRPLVQAAYRDCLANCEGDCDAYYNKQGNSDYKDCYTEGFLQSYTGGDRGEFQGGANNVAFTNKQARPAAYFSFVPAIKAGLLEGRPGGIVGVVGDINDERHALGWEEDHTVHGDIWRIGKFLTAQGQGTWETVLNPATSAVPTLGYGALDNVKLGPGSLEILQPDLYINFRNGSPRAPQNVRRTGNNVVTQTADSLSGHTGMIGWRKNGNWYCEFEVLGVFEMTSTSGTTPALIGIGTHNFPAGMMGRCIIRNNAASIGGQDHQWTRSSTTQISLQDFSNVGRTNGGGGVSGTGVAILGRLKTYGYVTGTSLVGVMTTGSWCKGDRFINAALASGDATEWVCTASGVTTAATWVALGVLP